MLGLKLNHVSKRGHWYFYMFVNTNGDLTEDVDALMDPFVNMV